MHRLLSVACAGLVLAGCRSAPDAQAPRRRVQTTYSLDVSRAVVDKATEVQRDLEGVLAQENIAATITLSATSPGAVVVTPADVATTPAIERVVKASYREIVEVRPCEPAAASAALCIQFAPSYAETIKQAALGQAVETIRARLDAMKVADSKVFERDGQIVIEGPATRDRGASTRGVIARGGKLELVVVDDGSEYMRRVFAQVTASKPSDVTAEVEQWHADDRAYTDYYLVAHDTEELSGRAVIERYLAKLAYDDPRFQVPADRKIGYELQYPTPHARDQRPAWRTYYLERVARLTGAAIANVEGSSDPNTAQPVILLDLTRAATRTFAELTTAIAGKKLAIVVDDRVRNAPVVTGPIRGGRVSILLGTNDRQRDEQERDELVNVLKSGALPSPLVEESVVEVR